eukprot:303883-Chlamydomonas_euryale.AAC.1
MNSHPWPPRFVALLPDVLQLVPLVAPIRSSPSGPRRQHDQPPGVAVQRPPHHLVCAQDARLLGAQAHRRAFPWAVKGHTRLPARGGRRRGLPQSQRLQGREEGDDRHQFLLLAPV